MAKLTETLVLARSRASDLENVRKLNVWGSEISDVSILHNLPNIQVASLSVNRITTLKDFCGCDNLEELYIRKNNISSLSEICYLKQLPKLRIMWLADNPCAVGDRYRMTVLKTLPNLQKLDNVAVQEEEINAAIEQGLDLSPPAPADQAGGAVVSHTPDEKGDAEADSRVLEELPEDDAQPDDDVNKIRCQLGLKPVPAEKPAPAKPCSKAAKLRNANLLQAVLCLVKELDAESLEIVEDAVRNRRESL